MKFCGTLHRVNTYARLDSSFRFGSRASQMPSSYSRHIGTASMSMVMASGDGVMDQIRPEQVIEAARELLRERGKLRVNAKSAATDRHAPTS